MTSLNELPPKSPTNLQQGERIFRTALDTPYYLKLDSEAMSRALRPYSFVKILLTSYLDGKLVYLRELPEHIQDQIKQHQATANKVND